MEVAGSTVLCDSGGRMQLWPGYLFSQIVKIVKCNSQTTSSYKNCHTLLLTGIFEWR